MTGITKNRQANVLRGDNEGAAESASAKKAPSLSHLASAPIGTGTYQPSFRNGKWGYTYMRYQRAYTRRQRAVTFAGATRTVTIPLEIPDFERLERLATEYNVGNATLCRQIIRQYLKRKAEKGLTLEPTP